MKPDPVLPGRRHQTRVAALLEVGATDVDDHAGVLVAEQAQGTKEHAEPLAPLGAGAEDDAERPLSTFGRRAKDLVVDPRRDHPVGAGERDRGGVAGGRRRGDRGVERVEQAAESRPRGPERPHLLGVGVKGRDQRTAGIAQRRPAEAGYERLVEVQQVEVLGAEQDVDVGDEVRRRGDELERPALLDRVRGAGEEEPRVRLFGHEDRVPLAGEHRLHAALRLVDREPVGAGRDHRDAVPGRGEPLGERLHLPVHGRRCGPQERREDTELERHAPHATARRRATPDARARGPGRTAAPAARPAGRTSEGAAGAMPRPPLRGRSIWKRR